MEKGIDRISSGQLVAVFRLAALSVTVGVLPRAAARQVGQAGWLAPLMAAPVLWLVGWLFYRLTDRGRTGYAAVCRKKLGTVTSAALYIIYIVWGVALAGARLRLSAQRLLWVGRDGPWLWMLPVLTLMAAWLVWGKPAVFARSSVLLGRGVVVCLALVLALTLSQVRKVNLLPVWMGDVLPAARAGVTTLGLLCCGFYAVFLPERTQHDRTPAVAWGLRCVLLCLLLTGTIAVVLGVQGAPLTAQLSDPFLALSRHAGLEGAFQRVESLVCGAWLPADLVLLGLVFYACKVLLACLWPCLDRRVTLLLPAVAVPTVAVLCFSDAAAARTFCERWLPVGGLVLFAVIPGLLLLVSGAAHLVAKREQKGQI